MIECALDQLDFIALNLFIEIDALVIELDLLVAITIGSQFELQTFNLSGQCLCKKSQLPYAMLEFGGVVSVGVVYVFQ